MGNMKPTQAMRVLDYIREFGSISSLEAFKDLGVTRLSARIFELRHYEGYDIISESETMKNRFGDNVTYSRYKFAED